MYYSWDKIHYIYLSIVTIVLEGEINENGGSCRNASLLGS